ncbi:TauD/TfdA family dioxygenase [Sorangium sp. So ce341]|uniref:TauD/TfdA family dioxygenase n=1 Tax=Sorangium sp. So ce341 TaxID=3133302 RepID=UPI003F603F80
MSREQRFGGQVSVSHVASKGRWKMPVISLNGGSREQGLAWLRDAAPELLVELCASGAVLLRGFGWKDAADFSRAVETLSPNIAQFDEESSPRRAVSGSVWTSTEYPAAYPIQFHNEYSYSAAWPMRLFFFCTRPAERGGETPLADSRRVLDRISDGTRARFERSGVLYQRRFSSNLGVDWRHAFHTDDPGQVSAKCEALGIQATWEGGELRTRQSGEAVVRHPQTREQTWFNHAFIFNVRSLEPIELREALLLESEDKLLTNTFYGDGEPIEDRVIEELRRAYADEALLFPWRAGDLLMIDNMLCSHARSPFRGARQVLTVMTDKVWRKELLSHPAIGAAS